MEKIKVFTRIRPLSKTEDSNIWEIKNSNKSVTLSKSYSEKVLSFKKKNSSNHKHPMYHFDHCFGPSNTNLMVYDKCIKDITLSSLKGINGTLLMYGQTGSGKTYSMMGDSRVNANDYSTKKLMNSNGILMLSLKDIFQNIEKVIYL